MIEFVLTNLNGLWLSFALVATLLLIGVFRVMDSIMRAADAPGEAIGKRLSFIPGSDTTLLDEETVGLFGDGNGSGDGGGGGD